MMTLGVIMRYGDDTRCHHSERSARHGTLRGFVNAGVTHFAPFESVSEQVYDELLTVNAKGPYFTVQRLAP
jgi:hypothetical protein